MLDCGTLDQLVERGHDIGNLMQPEEDKASTVAQDVPLETIMDVAHVTSDVEDDEDYNRSYFYFNFSEESSHSSLSAVHSFSVSSPPHSHASRHLKMFENQQKVVL